MPALIAYYSRADENYFGGTLRYIDKGNTQIAAEILQALTGADMFRIEQLTPYSKDYNSCIEEARSDLRRNARPELKAMPESLDKYDTIYLGFPNYWGTMPMAVFTFLERSDLKGKTIKPFCTNEGSGMGRLVREKCDFLVSIPMKGHISSLNASAAAAILLYEAVRRRM